MSPNIFQDCPSHPEVDFSLATFRQVMMPVMNGPELLEAVRASDSELNLVPIIFLTARAGDDDKVEGLLMGADGECFALSDR